MKCKQCDNETAGRSLYCSESCKTVYNRNKRKPEQAGTAPEPVTGTHPPSFELLIDETVYGRRAVRYSNDKFDTRPEPQDHDDIPDPRNRCIYQRQDGTRYLLDATGNQHERPATQQVRDMTDAELQIRLKSYKGASWVNSPEYMEVARRRGSNEQALQTAAACL